MDRIRKIGSGGKADGSASGRCHGFDGAVDGRGVEGVAVAFGTEGGDFVGSFRGGLRCYIRGEGD